MLKEAFNERQLRGNGRGLLVAATHQASEKLWAAHAELTFRTGCTLTSSLQTHTGFNVPGTFKESQSFLEFVT